MLYGTACFQASNFIVPRAAESVLQGRTRPQAIVQLIFTKRHYLIIINIRCRNLDKLIGFLDAP